MSLLNGESEREKVEQAREQQHERELHHASQQTMANRDPLEHVNQQGQLKREYIDKLTEDRLDEDTTELLQNMLTPDFILSNVGEAEGTELKWLARYHAKRIVDLHPPSESPVTGEYRKVCYDDQADGLSPLSELQESRLEQGVMDLYWRARRSIDGWQQEEMSKQYDVSEVRDGDDDSGVMGWFSS